MKRLLGSVVAVLLSAAAATPAQAQSALPLAVEARFGLGFPTGDVGELLGMGYGLGANATFNLTPAIGIYGGYSFTSFDFESEAEEGSYDVQGFDAGARLGLPMAGLSPYLRGGVVYYKAEPSDANFDSESELGFQVGVGLDYVLGQRMTLTPEVGYVTLPGDNAADVNWIRADFGLRFRL